MVFGQKDRTVGRDPAPAPMMLHDAAAPLALLSVVAAAVGVAALVYLASHAAAGPGWAVPAMGFDTLRALLAEDSLDRLIGPDGSRLVFFVREAFPSRATGTNLTDGSIRKQESLEVVSEMNEDGVIFGDGIEDDRIEFRWGMRAHLRVAKSRLHLVRE